MNPWTLLEGKKTIIGTALLFAGAFVDQVAIGMWDVAWDVLPKIGQTADWLGMAFGGAGLSHKTFKAMKPTATKEATDAEG